MTETAQLQEAIDSWFELKMDDVHTFFPAKIVNVRPSGLVDVQPALKVQFQGESSPVLLPIINNLVLLQTRSEGVIMRLPTEDLKGSRVGVFIAEHSLEDWRLKKGAEAFPEEARRFDINDAVAVLGLYPETLPWPTEQKPNTFEIQVKQGHKISIGDNNPVPNLQAEVLNLLYNAITHILLGTNPATGALIGATQLAAVQAILAQITNITPIP